MDNQHKLIKGYRDLTPDEINRMNEIKHLEQKVGEVLKDIGINLNELLVPDPDARRWLAEARTCLETGFMYAVKALARPDNGLGRVKL